MQPENSYFDEDSMVTPPPPPEAKTSKWLPISLAANVVFLVVAGLALWLWRSSATELKSAQMHTASLSQEMATQQQAACTNNGSGSSAGGNALDRFRDHNLGLVAVFYNNLGEEVPLKLQMPSAGNARVAKTSTVVLAPESDYQVDHLERLSFTSRGKASNTATLCVDIPQTVLPAGECKRNGEVCDQ